MAAKYAPVSHPAHTCSVDGRTITGIGPGPMYAALTDPRNPNPIFVTTGLSADNEPDGGLAILSPSSVGTVS